MRINKKGTYQYMKSRPGRHKCQNHNQQKVKPKPETYQSVSQRLKVAYNWNANGNITSSWHLFPFFKEYLMVDHWGKESLSFVRLWDQTTFYCLLKSLKVKTCPIWSKSHQSKLLAPLSVYGSSLHPDCLPLFIFLLHFYDGKLAKTVIRHQHGPTGSVEACEANPIIHPSIHHISVNLVRINHGSNEQELQESLSDSKDSWDSPARNRNRTTSRYKETRQRSNKESSEYSIAIKPVTSINKWRVYSSPYKQFDLKW